MLKIYLENISQERWQEYIERIPMLKAGVEVLHKLEKFGEAYIVGGAVRDIVSGTKEPHDIDIATNVPMEVIAKIFGNDKINDIGASKDFGIITLQYKGFNYEIAQFRSESYVEPDYVQRIIEE
jgi:tRNA nucleotidyltransferase (CCA-adding enzyme)